MDDIKNCREIVLFRAVIMQALFDVVGNAKRVELEQAKQDALEWFDKNNTDFQLVCDWANLDSSWTLKECLRLIESYDNKKKTFFKKLKRHKSLFDFVNYTCS